MAVLSRGIFKKYNFFAGFLTFSAYAGVKFAFIRKFPAAAVDRSYAVCYNHIKYTYWRDT